MRNHNQSDSEEPYFTYRRPSRARPVRSGQVKPSPKEPEAAAEAKPTATEVHIHLSPQAAQNMGVKEPAPKRGGGAYPLFPRPWYASFGGLAWLALLALIVGGVVVGVVALILYLEGGMPFT